MPQPIPSSSHDALRRAVECVGSQAALARLLGIAQPSVWKWLSKGKPLPAEYVLTVEAETGIPKEQLRPDLYRLVTEDPVVIESKGTLR
ncbi:cytoplasmic chaperone TorD [Sphingomonas sp. UV9]|nr:cytoplasmic chaperone TorD [Sphingomonas sp. UV9]